jgi:hypothetical protein
LTNVNNVLSGTVLADNTLLLKVYLKLKTYEVNFKSGETVLDTQNIKHGDAVARKTYFSATQIGRTLTVSGSGYDFATHVTAAFDIEVVLYDRAVWNVSQFLALPSDISGYTVLMDDIDFGGMVLTDIPAGTVSGVFEGNGYAIKNAVLNVTAANSGMAIFTQVSGTLQNIGFENITVNGYANDLKASAIVTQKLDGTVVNIYVSGQFNGTDGQQGIIAAGSNNATVVSAIINITGGDVPYWALAGLAFAAGDTNIGWNAVVSWTFVFIVTDSASFGGNFAPNHSPVPGGWGGATGVAGMAEHMKNALPSNVWTADGVTIATLNNGFWAKSPSV